MNLTLMRLAKNQFCFELDLIKKDRLFMKIIDINSTDFPDTLRYIKNPPQKLYCMGDITLLNSKCFAIVGSRHCTDYGKKVTLEFSEKLAKAGLTIVSGLAIGTDTFAHIGCLNAGGKTIAVLGDGFNHIFPAKNKKLYEQIIHNSGLIVSEYPPDTMWKSEYFLARNRIVSGLSIGTLVIEAAYRSGTSVTARLTKQQCRKLFCIPSNIYSSHGVGTNNFIREGAILTTSVNDIFCEYDFLEKFIDNSHEIPSIKVFNVFVPDEYKPIYNLISKNPISVDLISKKLNLSINEINSALLVMEINGYVRKLPGNFYEIV